MKRKFKFKWSHDISGGARCVVSCRQNESYEKYFDLPKHSQAANHGATSASSNQCGEVFLIQNPRSISISIDFQGLAASQVGVEAAQLHLFEGHTGHVPQAQRWEQVLK